MTENYYTIMAALKLLKDAGALSGDAQVEINVAKVHLEKCLSVVRKEIDSGKWSGKQL